MTCYRDIATVQKPYQYVGHEENTYAKDFASQRLRFCLAFPDSYEIGMANVGMQIIYHVINETDGLLCDRVYAPLVDMAQLIRASGQKLQGRESARPLCAFDCVGFTLQYELCYTNILYMLDLGGIPRRAKDRSESDPLVMAGGPCVFNPEPIAAFFDFFVIGEGEEVAVEALNCLADAKEAGLSRRDTLARLSTIAGIYVPSFYHPTFNATDGRFLELQPTHPNAPRWVERRIIQDLNAAPYPTRPVTPAITPIHERVSVEIQRGCTRSCRFCQAGYIYRPRRERNPNKILEIIEKSVAATGIQDIGLLSLSSADYSHLHPVMKQVMARYKDQHLSVSLPSTRLEALDESYLDVLKEERRSGFTIAPEAGSQRLRNVINKNFTEDEVVETARMLFRNGWQSIKMYFMIGQPTETDEDVVAIAAMANTVIRRTSDIPGRKSITVSISNFVPKPHTPFQWHQQISHAEVLRKQALVRDAIQYKDRIRFRSHSADNSFAEGLVARGDRRCADLIERAYELGAVFDCWQDKFDVALWRRAADELKIESGHDFVADGMRGRSLDERLPWHRVYCGIHPKFFKNEYIKAIYGLATEDCSFAACHECGLCTEKNRVAPIVHKQPLAVAPIPRPATDSVAASWKTFRFQYHKIDAGVFVTVLDLQTMLSRAFRRAGIIVRYDNGMRPRPQLSMGSALPLGVSSSSELFDIELATPLSPAMVIASVNQFLPQHLALKTGTIVEIQDPPLAKLIRAVTYQVRRADLRQAGMTDERFTQRLAAIQTATRIMVTRSRATRDGDERLSILNLKDSLEALHADDERLAFTLYAPGGQAVSPFVVIDALFERSGGSRSDTPIAIHKTGFIRTDEKRALI